MAPTVAVSQRSEVELAAARALVLEGAAAPRVASVELGSALGLVLAQDVTAREPLPPFDAAAMDGFALHAADVVTANLDGPARLMIVGESRAGRPYGRELRPGQAVRISTGAPVPAGADAVLRIEQAAVDGDSLRIARPVEPSTDVRPAGDDVRAGELVLPARTRLGAAALGMLAALGQHEVRCALPPRVALILTGDELLLGRSDPGAPGAVRDSNSSALTALLRSAGAELAHTAIVADERSAIATAIGTAARASDLLIVCGGMSVGEHDHVRAALAELGARESFSGVAIRPGRPTWFGRLDEVPVFGLPGSPVAAIVAFTLLVAPLLDALQGLPQPAARPTAALAGDYRKTAGRTHAIACRLTASARGVVAEPTGGQGSHAYSSLLGADALALIPSDVTELGSGDQVELALLPGRTGWFSGR